MADLLIRNANIITLDPRRPRASALAISGGRITAIGETTEIETMAGDGPVLDLCGTTVVPGFIDSHVHFTGTGVRPFAVDLSLAHTTTDVLNLVAARVAASAPGELIFGRGLEAAVCP